jgi:hypothetical protein
MTGRLIISVVCILLFGCTKKDGSYFLKNGERIKKELCLELESIETLCDLFARQEILTHYFDELALLAIEARAFQIGTKGEWTLSARERESSEQLTRQLQRVLKIAGAQAVIEKCQARAVERIDTFEKHK